MNVCYDLWHNMKQGDKSVEEQNSATLNQHQLALPEPEWPKKVNEILSKNAFIFMLDNMDIVKHCIREQTDLYKAKEIAKVEERFKATTFHGEKCSDQFEYSTT